MLCVCAPVNWLAYGEMLFKHARIVVGISFCAMELSDAFQLPLLVGQTKQNLGVIVLIEGEVLYTVCYSHNFLWH